MNRTYLKVCRHICKFLIAAGLLCWLLWTYQHPVVHGVKYIISSAYRECALRRRMYEVEEKSTQQYVTTEFHGRLGNWMFSYASLLGIAKASGYIPYFLASHPLNRYFALTKIEHRGAECLFTLYDDYPCTYTPQFLNLPAGNITIEPGYLQSWKYFRFIENEVRSEFKMHDYIMQGAQELYLNYVGSYLREGRLVISIHVRRGDVLRPAARKLGFCHAPKSYFDNAMRHMLQRYPNAVFLVVSDDIEWCKANLVPPRLSEVFNLSSLQQIKAKSHVRKGVTTAVPIVFSKGHSSFKDFTMLTLSNHSIMSVGTFGWWGAWMANGHVVYYSGFPLPGTQMDRDLKKEDFFPEKWVALSASVRTMTISLYHIICAIGILLLHVR